MLAVSFQTSFSLARLEEIGSLWLLLLLFLFFFPILLYPYFFPLIPRICLLYCDRMMTPFPSADNRPCRRYIRSSGNFLLTLGNWHWNNSSARIPLSAQQHSNYNLFISEWWVSTAWYSYAVCDTFFITECVYPARPLPLLCKLSSCAPPSQWDRVGAEHIGTV